MLVLVTLVLVLFAVGLPTVMLIFVFHVLVPFTVVLMLDAVDARLTHVGVRFASIGSLC